VTSLSSTRSFHLLQYLEWLLLGLITLNVVLATAVYPTQYFLLPAVLSIAVFGAVGLKIPTHHWFNKALYIILEFGIILMPNLLNRHIPSVPLLGLIAVIRSFEMFRLTGRIVVATLAFLVFLYEVFWRSPFVIAACRSIGTIQPQLEQIMSNPLNFQLGTAVSFGLTVIFAFPLVFALLAERQSRTKLAIAHQQLHQYASLVEDQATLQERNRIAREIHDSLGHALTAQSIQLENALLFLTTDQEKAEKFLVAAKQLSSTALREVRQSITTLRTPLQEQSLEVALAEAVQEFCQTTNILPECIINLPQPLPLDISIALHRITQEALANIYKHSAATEVTILLEEREGIVHLRIEDNGRGFNLDRNTTGFGLQGMQERAIGLGGQFALLSQPGAGCRISVIIPLPKLPL
jgi:signal transduction histidine kinase